jgi:siderophore synthetase component
MVLFNNVIKPITHFCRILNGMCQQIALPVQYGALACIWRESIYSYLKEGESATPVIF